MNRMILSNSDHPHYLKLKELEGFVDYNDLDQQSADLVLDFTALDTASKKAIFEKFSCPIISDLSLNFGYLLMEEMENLVAAVATVFPSPKAACEVVYKNEEHKSDLIDVLAHLDLKPVEISCSGIGFIFGRTMAQIINEAWFSLEDNLATKDAIDTAMLYGVNYPKGPLAWGEEAGLKNIVTLLEELYSVTKQGRYIVCPKLKEASL